MPMYEFQCPQCGYCFEDIAPINQTTVACPSCGANEAARIMSAPNLKTGAAPFKVGPVRPMPPRSGGCSGNCGGCGSSMG